ncbi:MAG: CDP-diacylglycerol--glycerol-3-phosphate 3-phosphatidyltransferase [Oscillospiraceae bacterium]|nr:CDP-diacylglycerol--glycerol-3-phosphate 3-phosphatidyltransferase [Oscillospiraceae bacterium]
MNLPNKLTVLRVLMIPLFLLFYYTGGYLAAFFTFALASITDALDGYLARKYNLVTDFGKLMDPLADKLLTIAAFVVIISRMTPIYIVCLVIIISREFIVTSIRLVAAEKGIIIAADKWGKLKTVSQMVWICFALLFHVLILNSAPVPVTGLIQALFDGLFIAMMLLTVFSGINYCVRNRNLFRDM